MGCLTMIETNRTYKVEVAQGQTFMDQLQFLDEDNTPFDWTGWTGEAAITNANQTLKWDVDLTFGGNGYITLRCETEAVGTTPALPTELLTITVRLVDPDTGAKEVFINGAIVVYKSAMWEESA